MVALGCWMVWSGSRPACLPLPFICLPGWVLVVGFPAGLSPTSFHLSPTSFLLVGSRAACPPLPLICLPLLFICLPLLFICLPGWVLVVGFPAGLSPTSFHSSPSSFHLSLRLGAFVSDFLGCVSHFFSFVSQAGCLWSGSRLPCLPLPCICFPFPFICLPLLFICGVSGGLSPTFSPNSLQFFPVRPLCHCWCPPISTGHVTFLFIRLPGLSLLVRPFPLAMPHVYSCVSQVCHWWCPPFSAGRVAFLFICLPGVSLLMSALFRWPCSISVHLSPRPVTGPFLLDLSAASVTAGVRPFPLAM